MSDRFLNDALSLENVPRWVIVRTVASQSVAEHSFNVAMICIRLLQLHPNHGFRWYNVIWHALLHDLEESVTGDIPSNAKDRSIRHHALVDEPPESPMVTLDELHLVKLADIIETTTWIMRHGVGPHAKLVATHMQDEFFDHMKKLEWVDRDAVSALVQAVAGEYDRLRTRGA